MKKFLMISCLLFACMAIQAAGLRSFTQPPENDVGYVAMTAPHDTSVMYLNMETIDLQWLGTTSAEQDCIMPEQASTDAVVTAETETQVRLAEFRCPGIKNLFTCTTTTTFKARSNLGHGAIHNYFFDTALSPHNYNQAV